jgi:uncharacterized protein YigE (DUF2233 family)
MKRAFALTLLFAAACQSEPTERKPVASVELEQQSGDCRAVRFEDSKFTHCIARPGEHKILLRIKGKDGVLFRNLKSLANFMGDRPVSFAMNAGMYGTDSTPIGYYVEDKDRLAKLNRVKADGNFYMQPNGVFFGNESGGWTVMTSADFEKKVKDRPDFGTQSGPMLLINGKLHPDFTENGESRNIRNGVGVDKDGAAHFVISDVPVSFGRMARMMRDIAKTPNALYLDGKVSALWNPANGRMDVKYPLGPMMVVLHAKAKKEAAQ